MHLSEANRHTLLIAANQSVEEYATGCAEALEEGRDPEMVYPPNGGFTAEEIQALKLLQGNTAMKLALRKVLADCAANVVFDLLNLIDGTTDPKQGQWSEVVLVDKPAYDEHREFLHDEFFGAYWDWQVIRPDKTWRLDLLAE